MARCREENPIRALGAQKFAVFGRSLPGSAATWQGGVDGLCSKNFGDLRFSFLAFDG